MGRLLERLMARASWGITDPGDGAALPNDKDGVINIVTGASGETNTMADPVRAGVVITLSLVSDGGGDRVITFDSDFSQVSGQNVLTLGDAGDSATFKSVAVGSGFAWRLQGQEGTEVSIGDVSDLTLKTLNVQDFGVASGSISVWAPTFSNGRIRITAADSGSNYAVDIINAATADDRVYTIADAGADASFVHTGTAAQTIAGDLTVSGTLTNAAYTQTATNIDAGASGTAGSVDVFPTTASKGKLAITCTDQTGDTTVSLVAGAMAAARTITLADPLANADILTGKMAAVARTATADGLTTGTIADAGLIQFVAVTSADANHIVVLPTPTPGRIVILYVGATGYELRSSDPATIAINGGTGAGAESAIGANMMAVAICTSATTWHGFTITGTTLAAIEAAA